MSLHRLHMARFIGLALALSAIAFGVNATHAPAARASDLVYTAANVRAGEVTHESIEIRWDTRESIHTGPFRVTNDYLSVRTNATASGEWTYDRPSAYQGELNYRRLSPSRTYTFEFKNCVVVERLGVSCHFVATVQVTTLPHPVAVPPSNLRAGGRTAHSIQVRWTDTTSGETRFELQWGEEGTAAWQTRTVAANVTSASVTGLVELTPYDFRVRACAGRSVCSAWSPVITVETLILRCGEFNC